MDKQNQKMRIDVEKIISSLDRVGEIALTVIGDYSLDQYVYSDPEKDQLSVETQLPAYQIYDVASYPGIGGTVTNNLRSLGVKVYCIGLLGDDGNGFELSRHLSRAGADTQYMISSSEIRTNLYMKPMRGKDKKEVEETNRLDFRNFKKTSTYLEAELIHNLRSALEKSQGVIITDQFLEENCGVVTEKIRLAIAQLAKEYKDRFFFVDSRGFVDKFENIICKCNEHELNHILEKKQMDREDYFREKEEMPFFITEGENGISIYENTRKSHVEGFKVTPPLDICGAGDATNAGICMGLALGLSKEESALLGCAVSSITIEQIGVTGCAKIEDVRARLRKIL